MVKYVLVEVGVEFVGDFGLLLVVIVLFVLFESVLVPEQFVFLDFVVEELRQSLSPRRSRRAVQQHNIFA